MDGYLKSADEIHQELDELPFPYTRYFVSEADGIRMHCVRDLSRFIPNVISVCARTHAFLCWLHEHGYLCKVERTPNKEFKVYIATSYVESTAPSLEVALRNAKRDAQVATGRM